MTEKPAQSGLAGPSCTAQKNAAAPFMEYN
jgi:hypothetical protein